MKMIIHSDEVQTCMFIMIFKNRSMFFFLINPLYYISNKELMKINVIVNTVGYQ